jgi:hypothetical protein
MEKKMSFAEYIGFYDWEGDPCRILPLEDGQGIHAEIYLSGKGFCPVSPADVIYKASPIAETKFKSMIIAIARL